MPKRSSPSRRRRTNIRYGRVGTETNGILAACEELGIGLVSYSPPERGFLTGAISKKTAFGSSNFRKGSRRIAPEAMEKNQSPVDLLRRVGKGKNATPAKIALE
ncbi:aldo/keto reductase [Paracoccus aestuariivivens]|uniref:aldo/keto reductase n=1 Tax=Paracoccus aestuariivivens TaxID=1820333 RepID=UPI003CCE24DF